MARNGHRTPLAERFWSKVDRFGANLCWPWTGALSSDGYGSIGEGGRGGRILSAHRVAWFLEYGDWPTKHVLHSCDSPDCVNPNHLFQGNHADNMRDCREKGRKARLAGEQNPAAKLTDKQVVEIRALAASGLPRRTIARMFAISKSNTYRIVSRASWKHI